MTAEAPIDVVVAAFPTEQGAKDTLRDLDQAKKDGLINIKDAAVLRKDDQSKLHISETADKGFGRGAMIGGVAGAAVGLLAGPVGWGLLGGAAVGGLAAKLRDGGFQDQRLRQIGEGLRPDSSAIVAVIEHTWVRDVERMMVERGADLATEQVASEIAAQLDADAERAQQQGGSGTGTPTGTP
jgi:uncharacterized membrane protein